ncbi:hypothetical protein H9M94_03120 [Mycoplasma sp. Pen4]|uniref:Mbov_0396 family ICE element transmembrane protein n=1 Tax=Mycoplasma sp. Pen4 TaxID=640330 RepID=UPI0016542B81|nr:hypothetical protein [Mycoplasma sp. Pen4]QNM93320.1 hypothetical protein H9M94_01665 [Mycoplasma sp. Pen4]QNM93465.1 hypothetical protein H9M94_02540 [Mycoplasma sp. Pen4]QNM93571.1 hypothetical protein H9M94_03120 [Mycoplasma sp. Pen4]
MFAWLINSIGYAIFSGLWYILVFLPGWILHIIYTTLEFVALKLPIYILFGGYEINFSTGFFIRFFGIALICLFFVVGIVFYRFIQARKDVENQQLFKESIKRGTLSFLMVVGIPILMWLMMIFFVIIYQLVKNSIFNQDTSLSQYIFKVLEPKWTETSEGHKAWIQVQNTFQPLSYNEWFYIDGSGILLIIKLAIAIFAIVVVIFGLFIRVIKAIAYEFVYFLWLPVAITQGTNDAGETLKKWFAKFTESVLSIFIILICLLLYIMLLQTTFEQVPSLIDEILGDNSTALSGEWTTSILSIAIILGMTYGINGMITRLMYFFNLDQFAESSIRLRRNKNKTANNTANTKETKAEANKTISYEKNTLKRNNDLGVRAKTSARNAKNTMSKEKTAEQAINNALKPWFIKIFNKLQEGDKVK